MDVLEGGQRGSSIVECTKVQYWLHVGSVRILSRIFLPTFLVSVRAYFSVGLQMAILA